MNIGIDIDGVLTDIEQWQLDFGSKVVFEKYQKGIIKPEGYDITEIFDVDKNLDDEFGENIYMIMLKMNQQENLQMK